MGSNFVKLGSLKETLSACEKEVKCNKRLYGYDNGIVFLSLQKQKTISLV